MWGGVESRNQPVLRPPDPYPSRTTHPLRQTPASRLQYITALDPFRHRPPSNPSVSQPHRRGPGASPDHLPDELHPGLRSDREPVYPALFHRQPRRDLYRQRPPARTQAPTRTTSLASASAAGLAIRRRGPHIREKNSRRDRRCPHLSSASPACYSTCSPSCPFTLERPTPKPRLPPIGGNRATNSTVHRRPGTATTRAQPIICAARAGQGLAAFFSARPQAGEGRGGGFPLTTHTSSFWSAARHLQYVSLVAASAHETPAAVRPRPPRLRKRLYLPHLPHVRATPRGETPTSSRATARLESTAMRTGPRPRRVHP